MELPAHFIVSPGHAILVGYLSAGMACGAIAASTYLQEADPEADNERLSKWVKSLLDVGSSSGFAAMAATGIFGVPMSTRSGIAQLILPTMSVRLYVMTFKHVYQNSSQVFDPIPTSVFRRMVAAFIPVLASWGTTNTLVAPMAATAVSLGALLRTSRFRDTHKHELAREILFSAATVFAFGLIGKAQSKQWLALSAHALLCAASVGGCWVAHQNLKNASSNF